MRLAKLTVSGFKSFADTTEFTFDHPVTGVVGPNGCGKSNIVDAIKWVLGERSSKSLRGTEMIDVIFAGSAGRKPGGMASVTLSFENPILQERVPVVAIEHVETQPLPGGDLGAPDAPVPAADASPDAASAPTPHANPDANADANASTPTDTSANSPTDTDEPTVLDRAVKGRRSLPIDADTVEVERRLYRDGESGYFINGRKARLKDIRELFLDTGVGADAYSIIEQGKVDAMLLASPQERRTIFEEAAGIAKYKQRRVEAQRKLDRAQSNLTTVRDQLDSTERRLRLVRGQAAKARKFKELDSDLRAWRLALAFEQYDDLEQRIVSLVSRHSELGRQREQAAADVGSHEAAKQQAELLRHEAGARHKSLEQERMAAVHAEQQASQRRTMLERAVAEAQRQVATDQDRLAGIEQRRQETESALEQHKDRSAALGERLAEAERRLSTAGEERARVLETLNEKRSAYSQRQAAVARIDRERAGLLASISSDAKRSDALREQIERLAAKASRIGDDQAAVTEQGEHVRVALAAAQTRATDLESQLQALEQGVDRLSADRRQLAHLVGQLDQDLVRTESRRATLQEMVSTRAGFAESVRTVLARRDAGEGFAGVVAPLADLIETRADVDASGAAAVEAALGADLQGLVVESAAALPAPDELARIQGRVAFLPMSGAGSGPACPVPSIDDVLPGLNVEDPSSRVVLLRSLVRPRADRTDDPGLHDLLDRLMGRTYLVSSVESALMLAAGPLAGHGARFVTRQGGVVIDPQGRVFAGAGSSDESAGILQRRNELERLQNTVAALAAQLDQQRQQLRAVDAEAGAVSAQAGTVRSELAQSQRTTLQEQNRFDRLRADAARLERERAGLDQELAQLHERLTRLDEDRARLQERADSLGRLQVEEAAAAGAIESELKNSQLSADAAMEQLTAAKVDVSTTSEQLASARRELSRLELSRDDLSRQSRDLDTQIQRLSLRAVEHAQAIEEAIGQIAAAQAEGIRLGAEAETAHAEAQAADAQVKQLAGSLDAARDAFTRVEREWHSLELQKRELEVKRETNEERISEELGIDLQAEYAEYRDMMADGQVARIDTSEAALRIDTLRDTIKKLGSVNLEAIDEESTLEKQNDELVRQVADIDAACAQLGELITRLNQVSRELFGEAFAKIQDHFGGDSGMFRKLFNGGKAEVRLMPLMKEVEDVDGTVRKVETDQVDLLESGIEVIAKPPGKEPRSISQLSGGEKTLTAVALLMSIFRSKPSCFCVLDEVDAALDEGNVGRFNTVVREYTDRSSFIVITHNKRTMQSADRLYGITQQERGVSTRVSVKFDQVGKNGEIRHADTPADAARSDPQPLPPQHVNTDATSAEPVLVAAPAAPAEPAAPSKRARKSPLKAVKADPGTLRQALAAMRELAQSPTADSDPKNN